MSKIFRYGNFEINHQNAVKRYVNYDKINGEYYQYFMSYVNRGIKENKILYLERAYKILIDLKINKPHHVDIMKIYRFIKKENSGYNDKLKRKYLNEEIKRKYSVK